MNRFIPIAASLLTGSLLAACAGSEPSLRQGVFSSNVPVVAERVMTYDLSAPSGMLDASQVVALDQWFDSIDARYGDRISLDEPDSGISARLRAQVQRVLAEDGLMLADYGQITEAPVPAGTVRVVVARASASVPNCPNYDSIDNVTYSNETSSNYGCATNSAIAAMVADPNDLLSGKSYSGTDAERNAKAISNQRDGIGSEAVTSTTGSAGN